LFPGVESLLLHAQAVYYARAGVLDPSHKLLERCLSTMPARRQPAAWSRGKLMSSCTRALLSPDVARATDERLRFVANRALGMVRVRELDEHFWLLFGRVNARLLETSQNEPEQRSALVRLEQAAAGNGRVRFHLATAYRRKGQYQEALSQLEQMRQS